MLTDQSVEISSSRRFLEDQEERDFGGNDSGGSRGEVMGVPTPPTLVGQFSL